MITTIYKALFFLSFIAILFSCKSDKKQSIIEANPEFANYISAHTAGLISKHSAIELVLQNNYNLEVDENNKIKENLLSFSPKIDGELFLENKNTLKFIPNQQLKSGQSYTGKLSLNQINSNIDKDLQSFPFQFQVVQQNYRVQVLGIENPNPNELNRYQIKGDFFTADVAEPQAVKNTLTAKLANKSLPIDWIHEDDGTTHHFTIQNLSANQKAKNIDIELNGKPLGVNKKESIEQIIPAESEFKITQIHAFSYPEQYILVNFSKPLASEYYDGLVTLKAAKSNPIKENESNWVSNLSIDGNYLKIYPKKKIGGDYDLTLSGGFKSTDGKTIQQELSKTIQLQNLFPKVEMLGSGNVIPSSDSLFLPFRAEGLHAVRVTIKQIYQNNIHQFFQKNQYNGNKDLQFVGKEVFSKVLNLSAHQNFNQNQSNIYQLELSKFIQTQPGAIYNVEFSFEQDFAAYPCSNATKTTNNLTKLEPKADEYFLDTNFSTDNYYYYNDYYYPEGYSWRERDNPCHVSYYTSERTISKNILASNLGVIVKNGNDRTCHVAVTDLLTTKAVKAATVEIYDLQNQLIGTTQTNGDGFAQIPLKRKPFLVIAKKGKQNSYVRVDDGSSLSLSNFNVEGQSAKNDLAGMIYGERGVWRPGDDIYLTFVVNQEYSQIPNNLPAVLQLKNPDGQIMEEQVNNQPINGFYSFKTSTPANAKTGNWTASIKLGSLQMNKTLKIETIKPNRLKIKTKFPSEILSKSTNNNYELEAQWLSGANAQNLKAKVDATIFSEQTAFANYKNYVFDDASRTFSTNQQTIYNALLDASGKASITTNLADIRNAPGMLNLGLFTKVFESSGEFSTKYEKKKFSPYNSYAGLKIESDSDLFQMLETGKNHNIPIASVDYLGTAIDKELEVSVYHLKNSWWYNASDYSLAYYVSKDYEYLYDSKTVKTQNGKANYSIQVKDDDWGKYLIRVCDPESQHCAAKEVWFDWPDWRSRANAPTESASLLSFQASKTTYQVGEKAQINIPSSLKGKALVSFENGLGIIKKQWINTSQGNTKFNFDVTKEMAPNFYVSISMLQPHSNTVNDLPIRMYGTIPIQVEDKNRNLEPIIDSPKEIQPNSQYKVKIKEKMGKAMTYTLAVVDEGLLDITNYQTPNIYDYFNQKQALGVKTWDIFNFVLGAFGGKIESVFAIGGDLALNTQNKDKISRYKPVVKYLGPFNLEKGKSKSHTIDIGNYVGRVKVMAVAANKGQYGSADKSILVKKPLMTLTTLPRVLNPGDEIAMPISVFAMNKNIKTVQVNVQSNDLIQIQQATQTINFTENGEKLANFSIKIPNKIGKATVKITAQSGQFSAQEEIELLVRAPNPSITKTLQKTISKNETWTFDYNSFGITGTNKMQLQLSSVPPIKLEERLQYLIQYPHGCIEQTVSSVFPQLYLNNLAELNEAQKKKVQTNINQGLERLKSFQTNSGGLAYWPGNSNANNWGTNYALHFLLKSESKGYALPIGLKNKMISYQKQEAKQFNAYGNPSDYEGLIQAYRLFTLALAKQEELALMNRLKESNLSKVAKFRLAAAYNIIGQNKIAESIIQNLDLNLKEYQYNRHTFGSSLRDQAMMLETFALTKKSNSGSNLLKQISAKLNSNQWYSTQTTAYALLAISEYLGTNLGSQEINATVKINGKEQKINTNKPIANLDVLDELGEISLINQSSGILFVDFVRSGIPAEQSIDSEQKNLSMRLVYKTLDNQPINIDQIKQGTDFKCVAYLSNPGLLGQYTELALTQIFPSGWEIINTRINNQNTSYTNKNIDYQDYRDDRVLSYFDLNPSQEISVTTLLNATYAGDYYLPTTLCSAMYNNNIYAVEKGKRVSVVQ